MGTFRLLRSARDHGRLLGLKYWAWVKQKLSLFFAAFTALVYGFVAIGGWLGIKSLVLKGYYSWGNRTRNGYAMVAFSDHDKDVIYWGLQRLQ